MPITITITDPTPEQIAALFGLSTEGHTSPAPQEAEASKPAGKARATASTKKVDDAPQIASTTPADASPSENDDPELAAEIARDIAEAPAEPKGATTVVDAGTGKPMGEVAQSPTSEATTAEEKAMTMDEVRAAATRLAQADATRLKAILGDFGAGKLSEVKPDDLGDFAGRVLAALG